MDYHLAVNNSHLFGRRVEQVTHSLQHSVLAIRNFILDGFPEPGGKFQLPIGECTSPGVKYSILLSDD